MFSFLLPDFPLSKASPTSLITLKAQHLQLACQCPYQWTISSKTWEASKLARRKIVFRALLGRVVSDLLPNFSSLVDEDESEPGKNSEVEVPTSQELLNEERTITGSATLGGMKLGRLNSKAYIDWETFLQDTLIRLSLSASPSLSPLANLDLEGILQSYKGKEAIPTNLPARLACLHVLRSMVGPIIESLIIADRVLYLAESLKADSTVNTEGIGSEASIWRVSAVNLFELKSGSARNVALVVEPVPVYL